MLNKVCFKINLFVTNVNLYNLKCYCIAVVIIILSWFVPKMWKHWKSYNSPGAAHLLNTNFLYFTSHLILNHSQKKYSNVYFCWKSAVRISLWSPRRRTLRFFSIPSGASPKQCICLIQNTYHLFSLAEKTQIYSSWVKHKNMYTRTLRGPFSGFCFSQHCLMEHSDGK